MDDNFLLRKRSVDSTSRIEYIDAVKGLGMLLIILGHSIDESVVNYCIHSFHVPLFFLISGFFLKTEAELLVFLRKKWRQIFLPLLITHVFCFLILGTIFYISSRQNPFNVKWLVGQILYLRNYSLPVIWFLYAFTWGQIIVLFLLKCCRKYHFCISVLLFIISVRFSCYVESIPLCLLQGLCSCVFISLGYELKKYFLDDKKISSWWMFTCFFFLLYAGVVPVYMSRNVYPLGIWNVATSSVLCFIVISFIKDYMTKLNDIRIWRFLCHFGRFSLVILCFHCIEMSCQFEKLFTKLEIPFCILVFRVVMLGVLPFVIVRIPILRKVYIDVYK